MLEDARGLLGQRVLLDAAMVVEPGLRAPADMQGRMDVRGRPIHDARELVPVIDLLELKLLDRGPGDDQAVVVVELDLAEGAVERLEMGGGDVLRLMAAGTQQLDLNLERRVGELAHDLRLGGELGGHEVQHEHPEGTDVLVEGSELGHDEYVLALELRRGGQGVWNANGHGYLAFSSLIAAHLGTRRLEASSATGLRAECLRWARACHR